MHKAKVLRCFHNHATFLSTSIVRRHRAINSVLRRTGVIQSRSRQRTQIYHTSNTRYLRGPRTYNRISNTRQLINGGSTQVIRCNAHSNRALHLPTKGVRKMPYNRRHQIGPSRARYVLNLQNSLVVTRTLVTRTRQLLCKAYSTPTQIRQNRKILRRRTNLST